MSMGAFRTATGRRGGLCRLFLVILLVGVPLVSEAAGPASRAPKLSGSVRTVAGGAVGSCDGTGAPGQVGTIFGITAIGGDLYFFDQSCFTVRRVSPSTGQVSTIPLDVSTDGGDPMGGAIGVATDGRDLFVADTGSHTVRRVALPSCKVTTIAGAWGDQGHADGIGREARFQRPNGLAVFGGDIFVADTQNHVVRRVSLSSGAVTTLAGEPGADGFVDGVGRAARFRAPGAVAVHGKDLFVADRFNHAIRKVSLETGAVTTLAGSGKKGRGDGIGSAASFDDPSELLIYGDRLFVADAWNHAIREVSLSDGRVTTRFGNPGSEGFVDDVGMKARFRTPSGIARIGMDLFVADSFNAVVRRASLETGSVSTVVGIGKAGCVDGGPSEGSPRFLGLHGLATDGKAIFVADTGNHTIRRFDPATGTVTTVAGAAGLPGGADGVGLAARFQRPMGVAFEGGSLLVADSGNNAIRRIDLSTGTVSTVAGRLGEAGFSDSADGGTARFRNPIGIAAAGGQIYVADTGNHSVRAVSLATGAVSTVAGTSGSQGLADGPRGVAGFFHPGGLAAHGGSLFVTEGGGNRIRRIDLSSGAVTTFSGVSTGGTHGDGAADTAYFNGPLGIATDGTDLYVADVNSAVIRRVSLADGFVSTLAGLPTEHGSRDGTGSSGFFETPVGVVVVGGVLYVSDAGAGTIRRVE